MSIRHTIKLRALPRDTTRVLQILKDRGIVGANGAQIQRQHLNYWLQGGESGLSEEYVAAYREAFRERIAAARQEYEALRDHLHPVFDETAALPA